MVDIKTKVMLYLTHEGRTNTMSKSTVYIGKLKRQKESNKIALTKKIFNLEVLLYGSGELASWIQNVKHTTRLLLTVRNYRTVDEATPTNSRNIYTSLSTATPQLQVRTTKSERITIKSTLKKH